jgi:RimJ/RimL family protein N-acetyltransferase
LTIGFAMIVFETERTIIRRFVISDLPSVQSFWCDPEVKRFFPGGATPIDKVQKSLENTIERYHTLPAGMGMWAVDEKTTRATIGHAALGFLDQTKDIEIGYLLQKNSWGHGLGTEIAKGLIDYGFSTLKLDRIVAIAHPENARSISIIKKSGMRTIGPAHYYGMAVILFEATSRETALAGGRTTKGVVRIGDTVRRPPGQNAGFVRCLLRHLEAQGFEQVPRHLGADDLGREVFTYVPGSVPENLGHHEDSMLVEAAKLMRRYHDATVALFATREAMAAGIEVACHNDLSPCNTVFRDGQPIAIIDFDAAAPGSRAFDLGYAAWLWLDVGAPNYSGDEQLRRLQLFADGYGPGPTIAELIDTMVDRQRIVMAEAERFAKTGMGEWAATCHRWTIAHLRPGKRWS